MLTNTATTMIEPNPRQEISPTLLYRSMQDVKSRNAVRVILTLLIAAATIRLVTLGIAPLIPEEAYYWLYAQNPSLSYFDHPPMVAWIIALGTQVFGNTEFGVRIVNTLLMLVASAALYGYGRLWFSHGVGLIAALSLHVLPVFFGVGFFAMMDGALIAFWALGMLAFSVAVRQGKAWGWYVAGLAVGGAMLSKYTGVFLGFGFVLAVAGHRPWRRWFLSPHPYLGALIAVVAFSPVLIWNHQHDWASFRFQFVDRYAESSFDVRHFLTFAGFQAMALTPVPLIGLFMLMWRFGHRWRWLRPKSWVTICFTMPLLLVTAYKAIRYDVHMNWTLPAFLALFPALAAWAGAYLRRAPDDRARRDCLRPWVWTAAICCVLNIGMMVFALVQSRLGQSPQFGPWKELAAIVEEYEEKLEADTGKEPLIVAEGKYRLASVLAFYRTPLETKVDAARFTTSQWIVGGEGLGFEYWVPPQRWLGSDCIYIATESADDLPKRLGYCFDSIEIVRDARLEKLGRRGYGLAICRGLRVIPDSPIGVKTSALSH